jgi:hypothetical protein
MITSKQFRKLKTPILIIQIEFCYNVFFLTQHHRSVSSFSELGNRHSRRNGSVPAQLCNHNNTINHNININININNNVERKTTTGILRRNSSRLQPDLEHRMRQRRVAVSFNSNQTPLKEFSPNDSVKKTTEEPDSTEI